MSSRKRKRARRGSPDYSVGGEGTTTPHQASSSAVNNAFFVQAHEATIVRDRPDLVKALTAHDDNAGRGGLVRWQGDDDDGNSSAREVWVDRYDARLLLTSLPQSTTRTGGDDAPPADYSPTGWSDLPSDSEETFFMTTEEAEEFRREKRRKVLETHREDRLRALRDSDPDLGREIESDGALWGGDDEEPDETQRTLMERTAKHLLSSQNSAQLEMRILANHGADPRFAFLRGRWRNAWQSIKMAVAKASQDDLEQKRDNAQHTQTIPAGGLVAYGDSDDEQD